MEAYLPVIIIVILSVVIVGLAIFVRGFRLWIEQHKAVLDCLSIVGVIGLVLSLLVTVSQFRSVQQEQEKAQAAAVASRMATLQSEFEVNSEICDKDILQIKLNNEQPLYSLIPKTRFELNIIRSSLATGDITDESKRQVLWDMYQRMSIVNRLFDQASEMNIRATNPAVGGLHLHSDLIKDREKVIKDALRISEEVRELLITAREIGGVQQVLDE